MPTVRSSKGGRPARVFDPAQDRQKALEQLRKELRHQRAENNTLQASRLFREFRLIAEQQVNDAERSSVAQPDVRARGGPETGSSLSVHQTDGSKAATGGPLPQDSRLSEGIWSTAGQPYSCLGRPEEVQSILPPLSVDKQRRKPAKRKVPRAQTFSMRESGPSSGRAPANEPPNASSSGPQILSAAQKRPMKPGPMDRADTAFPMSSITIAEFRRRQIKTAAAMFMNEGNAQADAANPKTWGTPVPASQHGLSPPKAQSPGKPPSPRSSEAQGKLMLQDADGRLLASRSSLPGGQSSGTMMFTLPGGLQTPVRPSRSSSAMPSARNSIMVSPAAGKADDMPGRSRLGTALVEDWGAMQDHQALAIVRRSQYPVAVGSGTELVPGAGWGPLTGNAIIPSRMHLQTPSLQRASLVRPEEPVERSMQTMQQMQKAIWAAHRGKGGKDLQGLLTRLPSLPKQPPIFPLLCPAFQAAPGDDSPACRWRNTFLQARQRQRKKLQMALWQRSQQRADARSRTGLAATACSLLTDQFQHQGQKPAASPSHGRPAVSKLSEARGSLDLAALMAMQRPPSELTEDEQAEMDMLEAFYRQLCRFAYAIKALDPICMALIYEVKVLLESGQAITRGLLIRSLGALAWFATGMGMQSTCNGRLLLLLRFLGRIVSLEEPELIQHARQLGILRMIYSAAEIGAMEAAMYRSSSGLSMLSSSSQMSSHGDRRRGMGKTVFVEAGLGPDY
ncbi:hypothetical protein WJX74_001385 [Apatococcus lobatus]|uniref:Uncharacterized protein n=1 Tax=Apatococcus lobatus TaxID=904363 RepID=A0AAW1R4G4_9CHLO